MKKLLIVGLIALTSAAFAGKEGGNGGDIYECSPAPELNNLKGDYNLDYIMMVSPYNNSDMVKHDSVQEYAEHMKRVIGRALPEMLPDFMAFLKTIPENPYGERVNSLDYIWVKESAGSLVDIQDEDFTIREVPENCEFKEQAAIKIDGVFYYSKKVFEELPVKAPQQYSFLVMHEWLRSYVNDSRIIRILNYYLHQNRFETDSISYVRNYFYKVAKGIKIKDASSALEKAFNGMNHEFLREVFSIAPSLFSINKQRLKRIFDMESFETFKLVAELLTASTVSNDVRLYVFNITLRNSVSERNKFPAQALDYLFELENYEVKGKVLLSYYKYLSEAQKINLFKFVKSWDPTTIGDLFMASILNDDVSPIEKYLMLSPEDEQVKLRNLQEGYYISYKSNSNEFGRFNRYIVVPFRFYDHARILDVAFLMGSEKTYKYLINVGLTHRKYQDINVGFKKLISKYGFRYKSKSNINMPNALKIVPKRLITEDHKRKLQIYLDTFK